MRLHDMHLLPLVALLTVFACTAPASDPSAALSASDSLAIADTVRSLTRDAYDLSRGEVVPRMMSVYPESGRVVSATAGRVTTSRDSLEMAVSAFWTGVGQFMVRPTWTWGAMEVDVVDTNTAVMTAQYTVPHWTVGNVPHVIGGVWTSLWQRRNGRWQVTHEHLSDMPRAAAEVLEARMSGAPPTVSPKQ